MTNRKAPPSLGPASVSIGSLRGPTGQTGMMGLDGADANEPIPIQGPQGLIGNTGFQGIPGIGVDGDIGPEALMIPGNPGQQGGQGYQGIPGIALDGDIGPEAMMIPGNPGPQGGQGIQGFQGTFGLDGDPGEDTFPIPSPPGNTGMAVKVTATGTVTTTGALQDITGCSISLPAGVYVAIGNFFTKVNNALNDRTFEGHCDIGGVDQTDIANLVFATLANDIAHCQQVWVFTLTSNTTVKLTTKHTGGTAGDFTTQTNCTLSIMLAGGTAITTPLLGFVAYQPATGVDLATTTTLTAIDATNVVVTFIAPISGKVMVRLTCQMYATSSNSSLVMGILEGASTVDQAQVLGAVSGTVSAVATISRAFYITGLTAGSSHTYKFAVKHITNGGHIRFSDSSASLFGPAVMEVWAV